MSNFQWTEDDFDLPAGAVRLGQSAPTDNREYIMYHGTTRRNAAIIRASGFHQSADGMLGRGVYLSRDLKKASRYPLNHPESDRVVIKVKVNVGKVIAINRQGHPRQKTWHDSSFGEVYDTAWVPPNCGMVKSGLEEDCVWDPSRIKIISTINPNPVPTRSRSAWGCNDTYPYASCYQWTPDDCCLNSLRPSPWPIQFPIQSACSAWDYNVADTNMSCFEWTEDDRSACTVKTKSPTKGKKSDSKKSGSKKSGSKVAKK